MELFAAMTSAALETIRGMASSALSSTLALLVLALLVQKYKY
jgi:hypothetical protein